MIMKSKQDKAALLRAGALQSAIFNSENFSSIATDAQGVIQIFNVGAERMLGYSAAEVNDKMTPAELSDPQEMIARAQALSIEFDTPIAAGFDALVYKATRRIEDIYELTYIRKDDSRFAAVVSVTALRDAQDAIIGFLLIGTDNTARKAAEAALLQAGALQNAIFNSENFSSIATDAKGVIQIFNVGAQRMLGYTAAEVKDKITPAELSDPQEVIARAQALSIELDTPIAAGFDALVYKASRGIEDIYELTYIRKDGSRFPALVSVTALRDVQNVIIGYLLIGTDNTVRKEAQDRLLLAASVFTNAGEGIMITDASGIIIEANDTFSRITGYSREEAIGKNPSFLSSGRQPREYYAAMWREINSTGYWSGELWNRNKSGELYAESLTVSAVKDSSGKVSNYVGLFADITQLKDHQSQLERMAHYDVLTNLPNRILLADRLSQAMAQCERKHNSLAVLFLDLDGFKTINDNFGHDVGDEVLIIISLRMKEALREADTLARIGGDEFVAVLADLAKVEDCQPVLERLLLAASKPITIEKQLLQVSASIGVTLYPQDGAVTDILLRHADQAMYQAKQAGRNRYHLFDTSQDNAVKFQQESLEAIRHAFNKHQFILHYQPKVNMRTGTVIGVEALIRWQQPEQGMLSPIQFLPIIENHAISLDIGEWVIDTALTQLSRWQTTGIRLPISVNISAHQLQQANFVTRLATSLSTHPDVPSHDLELEVLETSALDDVIKVSATMNACQDLGVNFALDDFGTGYSSLTYLRRLPASLIKIDQSFVRDMLDDPNDLAIVAGVISLAKAFGRSVIAEGVETIEHGSALLQLGCELAQGYGIAKPMPASDIPLWLTTWKPHVTWKKAAELIK